MRAGRAARALEEERDPAVLGVPRERRHNHQQGDERGAIGGGMDEPAALARRDRKENEETERKESRAVFRQAGKAEKEPDCEPERDDRRFRLEQQSRQRPSRGCEREEERAVGHDPAARRGEKERRRIERKNR